MPPPVPATVASWPARSWRWAQVLRPETALAASDTAALQRVRRLTSVPRSPIWGQGLLAGSAVALVLSLPLGLALAPAVEAAAWDCCAVDDVTVRN